MTSFRSRQRANLRRELPRDAADNGKPGSDASATPASGAGTIPVIRKPAAPQGDNPRDPYSARRPGPATSGMKQDKRRFDNRDGERAPYQRDDKPRFNNRDGDRAPYQRDDKRRFDNRDGERAPYQRDDKPRFNNRDGERAPYQRDDKPRFNNRDGERAPYQRDDKPRFNNRDGDRAPYQRDDKPRFNNRDGERAPYQRDDKPRFNNRDGERAPAPREDERRYTRDRGPSGRKPLHSEPDFRIERKQEPRKNWVPREQYDLELPRETPPADNGPRKLFGKPSGERTPAGDRDNRFRRDEESRKKWLPREQFDREHSRDDKAGGDRPRKLFGKPAGEDTSAPAPRENRFRRDEAPQRNEEPRKSWVPREQYDPELPPREDAPASPGPRKLFSKPSGERAPAAEREDRYQREEQPRKQWVPREQYDPELPRATPAGDNPPRKLFGKPAGERSHGGERDKHRDRPDARPQHDRRQDGYRFDRGPQRDGDGHRGGLEQRHRGDWTPQRDSRSQQGGGHHHHAQREERASVALSNLRGSRLALFAPCPRGLEDVLVQELEALGADQVGKVDGGVSFSGDADVMMKANLHSRTASRVLLKLAEGTYRDDHDIYRLAMRIDWPRWFDVSRSIKVKTDGIAANVRSLDFVSLKVKDAVCDRFRQAHHGRPNVDTRAPDVRIHAFLMREQVTLYLDTSGEPLFKRGWREETGEAPLRENLAAGILLLSGYDGSQALLDPMCGSGTFLVEAADIALRRAPGRQRNFGFERLREHDQPAWETLLTEARAAELPVGPLAIRGSDRAGQMVAVARGNLKRAGLADVIQLEQKDVLQARPDADSGLMITNPPYGVRMDEQESLAELYPLLGDWLKAHFAGWTAHFFTGDLRLQDLIHLSVKRRTPLFNGSLPCRLFVIPMVAGSARRQKAGEGDAPEAGADDQDHAE